MKRLNPETGKPFVRGDTRADGFLFVGYRKGCPKRDGYYGEKWLKPDVIEKGLKNTKDWVKKNPEKCLALCRKYQTAKINRTPPWLTREHLQQIESVYALAKKLTIETGVVHHVDHIVPLQGKTVSGLHVPWNLRAIPATENISKSNRLFD